MNQPHRLAVATRSLRLAALLCLFTLPASAGSEQGAGGVRALGQAGAVVARADDPAATSLNPAGLAGLDGVQVSIGALSLSSETEIAGIGGLGLYTSRHDTALPALAVSWKPESRSRLALGLSVDSPLSSSLRWDDPSFPTPSNARRFDVELLGVRPALAWQASDRLSLGVAAHWVTGDLRDDNRVILAVTRNPGTTFVFGERSSVAEEATGSGLEVGLRYRRDSWGLGVSARSEIEVDGRSVNTVVPEEPPEELIQRVLEVLDPLRRDPRRLSFTLPAELRSGAWVALPGAVTVELDAVLARWSSVDNVLVRPFPGCVGCPDQQPLALDDTLSLRLGVEWSPSESWRLRAGAGHEPGPLEEPATQPVLPAGDAWVLSVGLGRRFDRVTVDLAYSLRRHDAERAVGFETVESSSHLIGLSVGWSSLGRSRSGVS